MIRLSKNLLGSRDYVTTISTFPSHYSPRIKGPLAVNADVIRLNIDLSNLAILNHNRISLASVVSEERCGGELEVEGAGELACWVGDEADSGGLVGIEGLAPCVHAIRICVSLEV